MLLADVLNGVPGKLVGNIDGIVVESITYDSRRVLPGSLFAALCGGNTDGNKYIPQAQSNGCCCVLTSKAAEDCMCPQFIAADPRKALRQIAENFYRCPERKLKLVAITGTNGKTTIAQILAHALRRLGTSCGVLGTVAYDLSSEILPAPLTTPESADYQQYLSRMAVNGAEYAICEFSSQALAQERVAGDNVDYAVFTNLSRDHLDNHGNMENYFLAKKRLFDRLSAKGVAIINTSDSYAERIVADTGAEVFRVGSKKNDDIRLDRADFGVNNTILDIRICGISYCLESALIGEYNAVNMLQAVAVLYRAGFAVSDILGAVADFKGAGGRLERIDATDGRVAFVDYAHTDDALANALAVLRKISPRKLIVVFGCGGDRDRGKRPLMAQVAEANADRVILTNDNPRTEDPEQIMEDVLKGIQVPAAVTVEYDRQEAIRLALAEAEPGDVVLIAGKGHEDYQILGREKVHFDDREVVKEFFKSV